MQVQCRRTALSYKVEECLIFVVMISCMLIGFVSEINMPALIVFIVSSVLLSFMIFIQKSLAIGKTEFHYLVIFFLFLVYALFCVWIGIGNGFSLRNSLNSFSGLLVIYVFLCVFLFLRVSSNFFINCYVFCALIWTLSIYYSVLSVHPFSFIFGYRLSGFSLNSIMPFPLVAFCFCLKKSDKIYDSYFLLALYFLFFIFLVGYKNTIVLSTLTLFVVIIAKFKSPLSALRVLFFSFIFLYASSFFINYSILYDYLARRFDHFLMLDAGNSVRLDEIVDSIKLWKDSPLIGVGFGYEIENTGTGGFKSYTHNAILFYLTSTGILGVSWLYGCILFPLWSGKNNRCKWIAISLLYLIATSLTSAIYKIPQYNFTLAILLYLNLKGDVLVDAKKS